MAVELRNPYKPDTDEFTVFRISAETCSHLDVTDPVTVVCPWCMQVQANPPDCPMVVCGFCGETYFPYN